MTVIKPFFCIRPDKKYAADVAALPYDVYSREEAQKIVKENPLSFLSIDRGESNFETTVDMYSNETYEMSATLLKKRIQEGIFVEETTACLYLYELSMNGHSQTGIVGCASVEDYLNKVIKKHENTRTEKELDRTQHIKACSAHTGPIFLAYRSNEHLRKIIASQKEFLPIYRFTSGDGVQHVVYRISDTSIIEQIQSIFADIPNAYIADGHHRAAAAVNAAKKYREENPNYTGDEAYNYFLSVFFAEDELHIMDYNRVVKDLNGMTSVAFLKSLEDVCYVKKLDAAAKPTEKGSFTMLLENNWYLCKFHSALISDDPIGSLDVSLLQEHILTPLLGIDNPREDSRIDFIGGIRGLEELEKRCKEDCAVAFAMYPTSIQELFAVADADLLMPPKSTWFEPKLRSGLFVHKI